MASHVINPDANGVVTCGRALRSLWCWEVYAFCKKKKIIWNNNKIDHRPFPAFLKMRWMTWSMTQQVKAQLEFTPSNVVPVYHDLHYFIRTFVNSNTQNLISLKQDPDYSLHLHFTNEQARYNPAFSGSDFLSESNCLFNYDKQIAWPGRSVRE